MRNVPYVENLFVSSMNMTGCQENTTSAVIANGMSAQNVQNIQRMTTAHFAQSVISGTKKEG
ncbi:MAG: hypothetical protein U9Q88_02620 [Bacillota bacterium]|nr:hypothetical protein [Bacillota bacterium]